jgi:tRNA threonylcarbamoyladenosine biosynthesis protein TsaB
MKLLAIDTTESGCSAALHIEGENHGIFELAPRKHSELILPMIDRVLSDSGVSQSQLDAVAFCRGPGSFTGVRIAASVAQGLAVAQDLPIVAISSLTALAQGCYRRLAKTQVLAGLDARMSEVYWSACELREGVMQAIDCEVVARIENLVSIQGDQWWGVGSAWDEFESELNGQFPEQVQGVDRGQTIDALDVAALAAVAYAKGETVSIDQAVPIYLRDDVAAKPKAKRLSNMP